MRRPILYHFGVIYAGTNVDDSFWKLILVSSMADFERFFCLDLVEKDQNWCMCHSQQFVFLEGGSILVNVWFALLEGEGLSEWETFYNEKSICTGLPYFWVVSDTSGTLLGLNTKYLRGLRKSWIRQNFKSI